jgi:hypothetical protein
MLGRFKGEEKARLNAAVERVAANRLYEEHAVRGEAARDPPSFTSDAYEIACANADGRRHRRRSLQAAFREVLREESQWEP